ncbi:hypothetical protein QCA50_007457 [Cerrena zonata]|uniref:Uncharacterized protein n=1 Tax=Cerrena zonata TaxID=2478898 RepID=A0AAW0GB20_9APHY
MNQSAIHECHWALLNLMWLKITLLVKSLPLKDLRYRLIQIVLYSSEEILSASAPSSIDLYRFTSIIGSLWYKPCTLAANKPLNYDIFEIPGTRNQSTVVALESGHNPLFYLNDQHSWNHAHPSPSRIGQSDIRANRIAVLREPLCSSTFYKYGIGYDPV